jgi:multidrug efflux system outer membrane protein
MGAGTPTVPTSHHQIQGAFRNVSDGLVAYRKTREFRTQQELLFRSAEDAARLSHMRYNGGVTGYLEVLNNETNAFSTELGLVRRSSMNCWLWFSCTKR